MKRLIVLLMCLLIAKPGHALFGVGDVVFDPSNFSENVRQAITSIEQLAQLRRQYEQLKSQYDDFKLNWKQFAIQRILVGIQQGRDARMGYSALRWVRFLNDSGNWRSQVESILRSHYQITDRDRMEALLNQAFGSNNQNLLNQIDYEYNVRAPLLDPFNFQSTQRQAAERRQQYIGDIDGTMAGLKDKTDAQLMQTMAASLSTQSVQNEVILDALQMISTQNAHQKLSELSDRQRALQLEIQRIKAMPAFHWPTDCNRCDTAW